MDTPMDAAILIAQCNLNINLASLHVLAKYPHLAFLIQYVDDRTLHIILRLKALNDYLTLQKCDFQLQQSLPIFRAFIPETDSKHLRLDIELIQKRPNLLNRYHIPNIIRNQIYNFFNIPAIFQR